MITTLQAAQSLLSAGYSVIPVGKKSKRPKTAWKPYQHKRPAKSRIEKWFENGSNYGLGIVAGEVSGHLHVIDFETRESFDQWYETAESEITGKKYTLPVVKTPHGIHVFFRCESQAPPQILAETTAEIEGHKAGSTGYTTLIELLSTGKYARFVIEMNECQVKELSEISTISEFTRDKLLEIAQKIGMRQKEAPAHRIANPKNLEQPGSHFCSEASIDIIEKLLHKADWETEKLVCEKKGKKKIKAFMRRPGKDEKGYSGTITYSEKKGYPIFYNFSTGDPHFKANTPYNPFAVYTIVEHAGSYSSATKTLSEEGWGEEPQETLDIEKWLEFTEWYMAEKIAKNTAGKVRYSHELGVWYIWNGVHFEEDKSNAIYGVIETEITRTKKRLGETESDKEFKRIFQGILSLMKARFQNNVLEQLRRKPGVSIKSIDQINQDRYLLTLNNKTLNLRDGIAYEPQMEDMITKKLNVSWDPHATCPKFEQFIHEIFDHDEEMIKYVQKLLGYCLRGGNEERIFVMLIGNSNNGKTTLLELMLDIFGIYGLSLHADTLKKTYGTQVPNDLFKLQGKRYLIVDEVGPQSIDGEKVKSMVGNNTISARKMRSEWIEFRPQMVPFMATNFKPLLRADDKAIWNRLVFIRMHVTFEKSEMVRNLRESLLEEKNGIFQWLYHGYQNYEKEGINGDFEPDIVLKEKNEYRTSVDLVHTFIADVVQRTDNMSHTVTKKALYAKYVEWCKFQCIRKVLTQTAFTRRITELNQFMEGWVDGKRGWKGLDIDSEWIL